MFILEQIAESASHSFEELCDFYGRVLGLPKAKDGGVVRVYRVGGASHIGVVSPGSSGAPKQQPVHKDPPPSSSRRVCELLK